MGLSALDDPNCDSRLHEAPVWAENHVKKIRKTITTRCKRCDSIIEVQYKPAIIIKEVERGWCP